MASGNVHSLGSQLVACWLTIRVHFDAFRLFPVRYLTAAKWWVLRKRLRARGQFAPLLSKSPRAYELWAMRETRSRRARHQTVSCPILALVQANDDPAALQSTLDSLAATGIDYLIVPPTIEGAPGAGVAKIDLVTKPWLLPIRAGDRVASEAGAAYATAIAAADPVCRVIYADDDRLDRWGRRVDPHFKPDWNYELHSHHDILTGACIVRTEPADLVEAAQQADWPAALVEAGRRLGSVTHLRAVLHHRRTRPAAPLHIAHSTARRRGQGVAGLSGSNTIANSALRAAQSGSSAGASGGASGSETSKIRSHSAAASATVPVSRWRIANAANARRRASPIAISPAATS